MVMDSAIDSIQAVQQYLKRIQFHEAEQVPFELPTATLENLVTICRCHSQNIPFENLLFVHHTLKGSERPVDQASLHKRIVLRRRGGMCQEMNALLLHNLKLLGKPCAGTAACSQPHACQTIMSSNVVVLVPVWYTAANLHLQQRPSLLACLSTGCAYA